jgi:AmiR/NasT family two-component response regulator
LFAQQAAVLLANTQNLNDARRLGSQLTRALSLRDTIGAAKGILMAEGAADDQTAFSMLVATSQQTNVSLHEVARQLIASVTARHAVGP